MKDAVSWLMELDANDTGVAICTVYEIEQIQNDAIDTLTRERDELKAKVECAGANCGKCNTCLAVDKYFALEAVKNIRVERDELRAKVDALESALKIAINTVECASIDLKTGEELPWYRAAKAAMKGQP